MDVDVATWSDLAHRLGSTAAARRALLGGTWRKVMHDAYVPAPTPTDTGTRVAALRKVLPAGVAVSHRTALWCFGLDDAGAVLDVTAPRGRHLLPQPWLRPHSAALPDSELVVVDGLLLTSPARAVVDVARSESITEAVTIGDAALREGIATVGLVASSVESARGLRGVERARAVVPHLEPRSESRMESRVRMKLVLGGVPRPHAQRDLYDDGGHAGRADLELDGVIWEYDGREQRLRKEVFVHERRRQTRLAELGWEIRRLTAADYYTRTTASLCAEAWRALEMARGRDRSRARSGPDTLRAPRRTPLATLAEVDGGRRAG